MVKNFSRLERMVAGLRENGVLRSGNLEKALLKVDRADFVREEYAEQAYLDVALPIGYQQTISQPYTVIFMLELLAVERGNWVMDIGYGSGWQTALLAALTGEKGRVFAFEIVPELCEWGKHNVEKYPDLVGRVWFFCENAKMGIKTHGGEKLDRIVVAADLGKIPEIWRAQLKTGGILLYPSGGSLFKEVKQADGKFLKEEYPGFVFVPFV